MNVLFSTLYIKSLPFIYQQIIKLTLFYGLNNVIYPISKFYYFFFNFCKFGAETLTFPGIFLLKSASYKYKHLII